MLSKYKYLANIHLWLLSSSASTLNPNSSYTNSSKAPESIRSLSTPLSLALSRLRIRVRISNGTMELTMALNELPGLSLFSSLAALIMSVSFLAMSLFLLLLFMSLWLLLGGGSESVRLSFLVSLRKLDSEGFLDFDGAFFWPTKSAPASSSSSIKHSATI